MDNLKFTIESFSAILILRDVTVDYNSILIYVNQSEYAKGNKYYLER